MKRTDSFKKLFKEKVEKKLVGGKKKRGKAAGKLNSTPHHPAPEQPD